MIKNYKRINMIVFTSQRNFTKVYKEVEKFIDENKKGIDEVHFLYVYLERLERQFYFTKSQNISLDEALSKIKMIGL